MSTRGFHPPGVHFVCPCCRAVSASGSAIAYGTLVACPTCGNQFAITAPSPPAHPSPKTPLNYGSAPPYGGQPAVPPSYGSPPQHVPGYSAPSYPQPTHPQATPPNLGFGGPSLPLGSDMGNGTIPSMPVMPSKPHAHSGGDNSSLMLILGAAGVGASVVIALIVVIVVSSRDKQVPPPIAAGNAPPVAVAPATVAETPPQSEPIAPVVSEKVASNVTPASTKEPDVPKQAEKSGKYSFGENEETSGSHGEILAYKLDGSPVTYRQKVTFSVGDGSVEIAGTNVLTPTAPKKNWQTELVDSMGTAFVVSPDGYMLTCAHCVDGAVEAEVRLDQQTYRCRVIAADNRLDTALLKIEASGLPFLALAESSKVELAEPIRVIGFPIASKIGDNLKVTAGEVSGFTEVRGQKLIQTDAALNPGNSGGPVVDERGNVIGIASSKIVAEDVSNIAFCVPSDFVRRWAAKHNVNSTVAADGPVLRGPDIVRKVGPAVGLIKVKSDPVASLGVRYGLQSNAQVNISAKNVPTFLPQPPKAEFSYGECNSAGVVISDNKKSELPTPPLVAEFGMLPIESLASDGAKKWSQQRDLAFRVTVKPSGSDALFGRYGRSSRIRFSPFAEPEPETKIFIGSEVVTYEIQSDDGAGVKILKQGKARLLSLGNLSEHFEYSGSGTWVFDKQKGMTRSLEFRGKIVHQEPSSRTEIVTAVEVEDTSATSALASSETTAPSVPYAGPPKPLGILALVPYGNSSTGVGFGTPSNNVEKMVFQLRKAANVEVRNELIRRIGLCEIDDDRLRSEVVAVLAPFARSAESDVKALAWKSLARWESGTMINEAANLLFENKSELRRAALVYLGAQSDLRAARALVNHLDRPFDRSQTEFALKAFGPPAESVVIAGPLVNSDPEVRAAACRILGVIGGEASRRPLTDLVDKSDVAANEAKAALAKLK